MVVEFISDVFKHPMFSTELIVLLFKFHKINEFEVTLNEEKSSDLFSFYTCFIVLLLESAFSSDGEVGKI